MEAGQLLVLLLAFCALALHFKNRNKKGLIMNRNEAVNLLPIIKAFSEGRVIQMKTVDKGWQDIHFASFDGNPKDYRIKPKSKYRPFKDAEECWQEMLKHQPFGWIKCKGGCFNIVYVNNFYAGLGDKDGSAILLASKNSYQDNTFADGTPFGIKLED